MKFQFKRVYDDPTPQDGLRVLVDRLWPRGIKKEALQHDLWLKEIAPSNELRRYYHTTGDWDTFRERYEAELDANPETVEKLKAMADDQPMTTLLYAARADRRNHAMILGEYLSR